MCKFFKTLASESFYALSWFNWPWRTAELPVLAVPSGCWLEPTGKLKPEPPNFLQPFWLTSIEFDIHTFKLIEFDRQWNYVFARGFLPWQLIFWHHLSYQSRPVQTSSLNPACTRPAGKQLDLDMFQKCSGPVVFSGRRSLRLVPSESDYFFDGSIYVIDSRDWRVASSDSWR